MQLPTTAHFHTGRTPRAGTKTLTKPARFAPRVERLLALIAEIERMNAATTAAPAISISPVTPTPLCAANALAEASDKTENNHDSSPLLLPLFER